MKKAILVDAVGALVMASGTEYTISKEMQKLLEEYPNRKIILTGADDEQFGIFCLDKVPWEVFTLKHDPEKTDPDYYLRMLKHFGLKPTEVVYFEHNPEAVKSAESVGITTHYFDQKKADLDELAEFLNQNL